MYQPYIYLETRVLLSTVPSVFLAEVEENGKKDILSAKADFLKRNNKSKQYTSVNIQPSVLHKMYTFVHASGGKILDEAILEKLTGKIQEPPDDRTFTGFSSKVATGGSLDIFFHQKAKTIHIEEVRIEEDRGRLTRTGTSSDAKSNSSSGKKASMDWTYAGCPTMRIRTRAEFELGEEAELFLQELYSLLSYLKLISPEIGEASVRSNAYIALAEYPEKPQYFVKLRNLNSFNFVRKAINSELSRQESILSSKGKIANESRLWAEEQNSTESFQERSLAQERFATVKPEIRIPITRGPVDLTVELPSARRERLRTKYGLSRLRSLFICREKDRADYFEQAVEDGADPLMVSHWMAGELMKILNKENLSIKQCRITSHKFAQVMKLLKQEEINSSIAKNLLSLICETGSDVSELMKRPGMTVLSKAEDLNPFIRKVLEENPKSADSIKKGEMAPLEYLTGCVMKETSGRADPLAVKKLIKDELQVSVIYALTMGGSITAKKLPDGTVIAGDAQTVKELIEKENQILPVQVVNVRSMLSEETEPADWAKLVAEISDRIQGGTANGIVVTHGTDTLPYTAALLYWLFSASEVPIVLTASSAIPSESSEASENFSLALNTAREKKGGVYVVYGGKILSPLNLKYINNQKDGFAVWNLKEETFSQDSSLSQVFMSIQMPDSQVMADILNEAAEKLMVVKLYPGLLSKQLENSLSAESNIENVILELYGTGTSNMRNSDYSLKNFLLKGRKFGVTFYCTSQQESSIDLTEFSTSMSVRRIGAVPMGVLTTESVTALYFAASLIADTKEELSELMESSCELFAPSAS